MHESESWRNGRLHLIGSADQQASFQLFMFLVCRSWIAFISFLNERGLIAFLPFLKLRIEHSASLAWRERRLVENCFASARICSRYFGSTILSYSRKVSC